MGVFYISYCDVSEIEKFAPLAPLSETLGLYSAVPSQGRFCIGDAQTGLKSYPLFRILMGALSPFTPLAPPFPTPLVLCSAVPSQGRFCFGDAQTRLKSHHLFSFVA